MPIANDDWNRNPVFDVDLDSAIVNGIRIPTTKQLKEGAFRFSFKIENTAGQQLYYKIFYQNSSYKFSENSKRPSAAEATANFYGSWGENDDGFKPINPINNVFSDYFSVVGNPRNESRYYGLPMDAYALNNEAILNQIKVIKADAKWLELIKQKAINNSMPLEDQLKLDAVYALETTRNSGTQNHRWKRNPRMGAYDVMLVVCNQNDLDKIPDAIKNISTRQGADYINPFAYFLYGEGSKLNESTAILFKNAFTLKAKIDFSKGIYVNRFAQPLSNNTSAYSDKCNESDSLFRLAQVEQFFNSERRNPELKFIPLIKDIPGNEFTVTDYIASSVKYKDTELNKDFIRNASCPCKTVEVENNGQLLMLNPGNDGAIKPVKENVGIRSRIGFTYGKFTAKIAFAPQLNRSGLWNGLSNAFWLMFQDRMPWNNRSYSKTGYTEKGDYRPDAVRNSYTYYSEIDLELTKASRYWPREVYFGQNGPVESEEPNKQLIAAATNWDMADQDPVDYAKGFCTVNYTGVQFSPFRWEYYYQALTDRHVVEHDEIYNREYYYYQIEWKPTEIIFRIGPSIDSLKVVGYMNDKVTAIPDNQMLMVVSQEFKPSDWLPPMPFRQEYIPYLKNDSPAHILELTVE